MSFLAVLSSFFVVFLSARKTVVFLVLNHFPLFQLQPSDTAYPRFKSRLPQTELDRFYTVTDAELACCDITTRASTTRFGFSLLLKTYQRLGYFVTSEQVPNAIAEHVATSLGEPYDRENLRRYDASQARRKHLSAVREFLKVRPFGDDGKTLMRQTFADAARTKEDLIDIINIGIETLVRHRYKLPAFDTLLRASARHGTRRTHRSR